MKSGQIKITLSLTVDPVHYSVGMSPNEIWQIKITLSLTVDPVHYSVGMSPNEI